MPDLNLDKLDLLDDVLIDISVQIGEVSLKVSELMNLEQGMLLTLDEAADAPVKIYASGKFIGEGQIITANGRYSIKIL